MLRIELMDWEGNRAYSQYDRFHIGNEKQNYRLYLKGHTGTAGKQSSLILHGADFSTKDADNDNCMCKCALMLTGGWWFDACGPSNLNGMFYTAGQNHGKLNGIKWHYFKGPSYSLRSTTMMIRPLDFWRCSASIRKLQRKLGMFPDEKLVRGFRNNQHCLHSSSKWLCHVTWVWSLLRSTESPLGSRECHSQSCLKGKKLLSLLHFKVLLDHILNL